MAGGAQPPNIHLQLHPKLPLLGEKGSPPALLCPSQPCPSPSGPAGTVWGHCSPPVAWGYPDPRGVGLVPGCPPALRVWGLSGRVFFGGGLSSARPFLNVTIWTMPHIFLEGKATVSQEIMGAFLPLCQRREWGRIWGVGVRGFSFVVLFSSCWHCPAPDAGGEQGSHPTPPALGWPWDGDGAAEPLDPCQPRACPALPGGLDSALYRRQVKGRQCSRCPESA